MTDSEGVSMTRETVLKEISYMLCHEIFEDDDICISESTSSNDIEEWDSFEQINLLTLIEEKYGVKFDVNNIDKYCTVSKLIDFIMGEQIEKEQ